MEAMNEVRRFLVPGAQKTRGEGGGLLPALGLTLKENPMNMRAQVLPAPVIKAAGVSITNAAHWANSLGRANFSVDANQAVKMNVAVFCHNSINGEAVYDKVRDIVNKLNASYRFPKKPFKVISVGDNERHWGAVETHFSNTAKLPSNIFVIDFVRPRGQDLAYSVVKFILAKGGYLSQFVNFKTCDHLRMRDERDEKKSATILQGVARQIIHKCGGAIWWVSIPRSLPMPAMFVGVDVFHAPRRYDPQTKTKVGKSSCAAIIVQVVRSHDPGSKIEFYSQAFKRGTGEEYNLGPAVEETVKTGLKNIGVKPKSVVVWRDGVGDTSLEKTSKEEIAALRRALKSGPKAAPVPLAYLFCQKRIAVKFLAQSGGYVSGPPTGTLIVGLEDLQFRTFYITGTAPKYATPKPVRYIIAQRDNALANVPMTDLTWALCHSYLNWTGPIK